MHIGSDLPCAFWVSLPAEADAPPRSAARRYAGLCLAAVGLLGMAAASALPLMRVVSRRDADTDRPLLTTYRGLFVQCQSTGGRHYGSGRSHCEVDAVPPAVPAPQQSLPACESGTPRPGFTKQRVWSMKAAATVLAAVAVVGAAGCVGLAVLRGRGALRSAVLPFAAAVASTVAAAAANVLYLVASEPCTESVCAVLNDAADGVTVLCWTLGPFLFAAAALLLVVGGACAQRWAPLRCGGADPEFRSIGATNEYRVMSDDVPRV